MGNTILIVEDNPAYLNLLSEFFQSNGFAVFSAGAAAEAVKLASLHLPACFLLDYHLGGDTAATVCSYIRGAAQMSARPVIILSGDQEQAVRSYEVCQADVFVEKDRPLAEILAIVRRQLRRAEENSGVCKKADLALDAVNQRVIRGSYPAIELSQEQFRFFSLLFERSPEFVSDAEICQHVFRRAIGECGSAIRSLVFRLRDRLGPQLARRVKNRRKSGWIYMQPRIHSRPAPNR